MLSGARWVYADACCCGWRVPVSSGTLCLGALGREGNVALCLESQMGLHASQRVSTLCLCTIQHTRLALQPTPFPPSSRARWPVRTRCRPVLQRRPSVFSPMAAHISFASTVRFLLHILFCVGGSILWLNARHTQKQPLYTAWFASRAAVFGQWQQWLKGSRCDLLLFVWEDQAANLWPKGRVCGGSIRLIAEPSWPWPKLHFRGFVFASPRVIAQPALFKQGLNLAASNTEYFHPGGRVGTCPRSFQREHRH